jgi:hypothetical protein
MAQRFIYEDHRDCTPEDPLEFIRWSRNFVFQTKKNAKHWEIRPFETMMMERLYKEAKAAREECGPEPPPRPHPIDGFTIYWDKKRRLRELLCDFHGIPFDKNGFSDGEELARKVLANQGPEGLRQWKEYLLGHVRGNAARYNMPPEWVENIRRRLFEEKEPPPGDDGMQQMMFILYEVS